eukprot:TRINITY_DN238_c0_g1_i8.p1 TRINITY_DN238_c0_g1~~TRINITY_DN238_c0_g1_i8.p1  ORF type:complete len:1716 (+),score=381.08 TRINITY_DN238_c0_g1_i8:140-5149(+)
MMSTRMLTALLVLMITEHALGGYPQCSTIDKCMYTHVSSEFGDVWERGTGRYYKPSLWDFYLENPQYLNATCNRENWVKAHQCVAHCPLQLEITDPPEYRMTVCARDNQFQPFAPDGHIDLNHPLNGKILDVVQASPSSSDHTGCSDSDYTDKDYTNKIVMVKRGGCYFYDKFQSAALAGANISVMVNNALSNLRANQFVSMSGRASGFERMPAVSISAQTGDAIIEALDAGIAMKGRVKLVCTKPEVDPNYEFDLCKQPYYDDFCDYTGVKEEDRMCSKCSITINYDVNQTACLWHNDLHPLARKNLINMNDAAFPGGLPFSTDEMVLITGWPSGGCSREEWVAGNLAGKIVFQPEPSTCTLFQTLRHAQAVGVKAFIHVNRETRSYTNLMQGGSELITIPVHSLHSLDVTNFTQWVKDNGVSFNSTRTIVTSGGSFERSEILGYQVPTVSLTDPKLPAQTPLETPAPENSTISEVESIDGSSSFEWNAGVVITACLIAMLLIAIVVKFVHQRLNSVDLPDDPTEDAESGLNIPLSIASMGLSLTLLFIISGTAFTLAYTAGQDSTSTARNDGRRAVDTTYENAVENVESLSNKWQNAIVESAELAATTWFRDGELVARQVNELFVLYDGTWNTFQPIQQSLLAVGRQSYWKIHVKIEAEGFFMAERYITDDGSESGERPIAEVNNGYLYGINYQRYSSSTKQLRYHSTHIRSEWPPESSVGEMDQNPFDLTRDLSDGSFAWLMSSYSYPRLDTQYHPISVLTPIVIGGQYVGCTESMRSINDLSVELQSVVSSYPGTRNITSLMFDRKTGILVSSSEGTSRPVDQFLSVSYTNARESYSLRNTFSIEMNAYGGYMRSLYNGSLFPQDGSSTNEDGTLRTGRFDQKEYYEEGSGWLQTHFSFETHEKNLQGSSMIHDASVAGYRGEVRDGECQSSLACIVDAPMPGKPNNKALYLDKKSNFYLYINLPRVQRTRVSEPGEPWVSNFTLYNRTQVFSDGSEIVMYQDPAPNGYVATVLREPLLYRSITFSMWVNPSSPVNDSHLINSDSPRLFSDTYLGDAAIRWYANGIFYLGVSTFGCITDPIEGGPPVNQWTHLIATVDRSNYTCRVFVNGSLHSEHAISRTASYDSFEEPYMIGEYYHGMIDEFKIFNRSFTNVEAVDHYHTGGFHREVDNRVWNYIEKPITYRDMEYVFVILIPEEDILREVNANNEATRLNLEVQEQNTQTKLDQKASETIFILVAIALFSVLVFLVFNELLTRPFSLFAFQLTEAAVMRVDEIPNSRSFIREMNALHKAMALMVGNLKEYKSYMPQTLLAINESSSDSDKTEFTGIGNVASGSTVGRGGGTTRIGGASSAARSGGGRSSRGSTVATTTHSGSWKASLTGTHDIVAANCRNAQGKKAGMVLHLSKKKVSFCVLNIVNFHGMFEKHSEQGIIEAHGQCMNMALYVFQMYKGIPDTFCGDRMLCSFNAVKPVATHRVSACRSVLAIEEKIKDLQSTYPGLTITQSATSGDAKVGNMGTDGMKRFSFITPVVSWCFALERYCKHTDHSNLVDFHISEEAKAEFIVQHVASISYTKRHSSKSIRVTKIIKSRDARDVEWMYQLAEGELTDPFAAWNHTAKAIFAGEWKDAENFVQSIPAVVANGKLFDSFLQAIQEKYYNVPKIEFH